MKRENSGVVVAWILVGAVLGTGAALLLAPSSGKRTRRKLADQAERGRKTLAESGQDLFLRGKELYERGRELAEEAADIFERGRRIAEKNIDDRI